MISIKNLSKRYGTRILFEDVSFDVLAGEKVGLVGRNGHGKTTLFRIITQEEEPDQGKVFMPKNYTIGYLDQHLNFTKPTILEEIHFNRRSPRIFWFETLRGNSKDK